MTLIKWIFCFSNIRPSEPDYIRIFKSHPLANYGNFVPFSKTHWEELLQSVSDFTFSKHCGYRSKGVRGVKRPEILWEMQKYSLPGRPSTQNWVKSKKQWEMHQNSSQNGKWFLILFNFGWMVDLAMSIFKFHTKFLILWHPWHPWGCIRSVCWKWNLKQI